MAKTLFCLICLQRKSKKKFERCGVCGMLICSDCATLLMIEEKKDIFCIDCFTRMINKEYCRNENILYEELRMEI